MKKEIEKILEKYFNIYEYDNYCDLENWTDGSVNMLIPIDKSKNIIEELENFIENFNIDEEIEIHRENEYYKKDFTIRESLEDFENWVEYIKNIIEELKKIEG